MKWRQARFGRIGLCGLLWFGLGGCSATPSPDGGPAPVEPEAAPAPEPTAEVAAEPGPAAGAQTSLFTAAQALKGKGVFENICADCHTTSEFRGRGFQADWGRRSVYSFYRTIRSTMPDDNPGGLDNQVYLDVISYILEMNGHEVGSLELTEDSPMRDFRVGLEAPEGSS